MKKKKYVKPETVVIVVETESFICLSWEVKNNGDVEGGEDGDLVPPSTAGDAEWTEKKEDGGGIWGDLD